MTAGGKKRLTQLKSTLVNAIKFNSGMRELYAMVGGLALRAIGCLLPVNKKRVLFMSFGGRRFDDSPRAIYEAMVADPCFKGWDFVWAFSGEELPVIDGAKSVKIDSPEYFWNALTSRVWITNTSITRGMRFKKRSTISVNTWHGTPLKKMARSRHREQVDILTSQNDADEAFLRRKFDVDHATLLKCDLPRNDALFHYTESDKRRIKETIGLPKDKKVLLYMPTFRDYQRDEHNILFFVPPIDFARWRKDLGEDYVLLVRFHYLVEQAMDVPSEGFTYSVTNYPVLSDLYAIADIFVSDYSSSYIDFSILGRPMFCFAYDYAEYQEQRGFEVDPADILPCRIDQTEDELLESIQSIDWEEAENATRAFQQQFASHAGHATEELIDELKRQMEQGNK